MPLDVIWFAKRKNTIDKTRDGCEASLMLKLHEDYVDLWKLRIRSSLFQELGLKVYLPMYRRGYSL